MSELDQSWLITAFTLSNSVRALFYLPQVLKVARSTNGARDIALSTWWMWAVNNALGGVCTGAVMGHTGLALSFWAASVACLLTIALAGRARRRLSRAPAAFDARQAAAEMAAALNRDAVPPPDAQAAAGRA